MFSLHNEIMMMYLCTENILSPDRNSKQDLDPSVQSSPRGALGGRAYGRPKILAQTVVKSCIFYQTFGFQAKSAGKRAFRGCLITFRGLWGGRDESNSVLGRMDKIAEPKMASSTITFVSKGVSSSAILSIRNTLDCLLENVTSERCFRLEIAHFTCKF